MSYALSLRRMTPFDAAWAVFQEPDFPGQHIGLRGFAGITAEAAAEQAMPKSAIRSTAGFTQTVFNNILAAAQSGNFQTFNPSGCTGVTPSGAKIVNTVGGLALTGLSTGLAVAQIPAAIAAPVTAGASLLVGLFASIFAHHAAKVKQEQSVVCAAVPAASDSLNAIYQAVSSGTMTPDQGIQALQNLESSFESTVASIIKMDDSHCNAACVWVKQLRAIVLKKTSDYQDMITAQQAATLPPASTSTGATGSTSGNTAIIGATSGMPSWAWLAAAAVLFLVIK